MKKFLLSLAAVLVAATSFAYEVGDYIYTTSAKYKVVGDNLVPALSSWTGASDVDTWSVYSEDDATSNCLQSLDGSDAATPLWTAVNLTYGSTYVVTLKVKAPADATSSITEAAQNQVDAWVTSEASDGTKTGTAGTDYIQVAATTTMVGGEFTTITFAYTATDNLNDAGTLAMNIKFGRLTTETVIADAEIREVSSVYDTRIMDNKIDYINQLKATGAFTGESDEMDEIIDSYYNAAEYGLNIEDEAAMTEFEAALDEARTAWMDGNSSNLSSNFTNIGITGVGKYNRGTISDGQVINNFIFHGSNWLHSSSGTTLAKQIQGSYANDAGSVALYNTNLPAGKYYVACSVRNALCDKNYNYTYTLEKNVKMFVGSDSTDCGTIKGEDYTKIFAIGELKEGETFQAGVWWEGHTAGSRFDVYEWEIRSINVEGEESIEEKVARQEAATAFLAQYNAAVQRKEAIAELQANTAEYPWEQDSLAVAIATWTPYLDAVSSWVIDSETVADKSVVTTDQLNAWALYQGDEEATATYGTDEQAAATYQVVRGLQYALAYAQAQNQPYQDLIAKVAEAKEAIASGAYISDPSELNAVIEEAETLIAAVSSTNQYDEFTAELATLTTTLDEYYEGSASYATPSEVTIVDPNFTNKTGNITGGTTTYWNDATTQTGWVSYTTDSKAYFRVGSGGTDATTGEYVYEGVNRAAMWRGWTGNPTGSLVQEVTVSKAGHYDFKCQAYATGDHANVLSGVRKVTTIIDGYEVNEEGEEIEISHNDTVYMSGIHLLFGSATELKVDSIEIWTAGETVGNYTPQWFTIGYDKMTDGDEVLRFGIDGFAMSEYVTAGIYSYGPNAYGLGSCHLLYCGDVEQYYKDKETGINEVVTTEPKSATAKAGVYSITGQKVAESSLNNLPKGIYIMNGKKYMVK